MSHRLHARNTKPDGVTAKDASTKPSGLSGKLERLHRRKQCLYSAIRSGLISYRQQGQYHNGRKLMEKLLVPAEKHLDAIRQSVADDSQNQMDSPARASNLPPIILGYDHRHVCL